MTDFTINGTTISSLGFKLKGVTGHLGVGGRKAVLGANDDLIFNYRETQSGYFEESPDVLVKAYGRFATMEAAEEAYFSLLGLLVVPSQRSFAHATVAQSITFKGIMHKGTNCHYRKLTGGGVVFDVQIKILKTDD